MKNSSEKPRSISDLKTASMATDGGLARGSLTTSFFGQVGQAKDPHITNKWATFARPHERIEMESSKDLMHNPRHECNL